MNRRSTTFEPLAARRPATITERKNIFNTGLINGGLYATLVYRRKQDSATVPGA